MVLKSSAPVPLVLVLPGRVYPGKRMAGRLGGKRVTIRKLTVVDPERNLLLKGAVPGKPGSLLSIVPAKTGAVVGCKR